MATNSDQEWMNLALDLSDSGLGQTGPNPSVGCVLVKDNRMIAQARTGQGGRPHAEAQALQAAGCEAKGSTAYITLEPCAHEGATPSCARLLKEAGVVRVVIACCDPDPRTKGQGIKILQDAGIAVETGIGKDRAARTHAGFFRRIKHGMPYVGLKLATSLDGMMACGNGHSQRITGEEAREEGHRIRSRFDAILTGSGTVLSDTPQMTVRLKGYEGVQSKRFVLDRRGRLSEGAFTVINAEGVKEALKILATDYQINRVLVEAGPMLTAAFLHSGFVDEVYWFRAPILIGSDGLSPFPELGLDSVDCASRWALMDTKSLGPDQFCVFAPEGCHSDV